MVPGGLSDCADSQNTLIVRKLEARLLLGSLRISKALRRWTMTLAECRKDSFIPDTADSPVA